MQQTIKIRITKPSQTGSLLWLLIIMPFLFALLNELLGLPWAIRYLLDIAWCLLLVYQLFSSQRGPQGLGIWIWLFLIYTLLCYLLQWQSPLYYLWGVRNNFRFFVAFFAFAAFLTQKDAYEYLCVFDKLFWINSLVSCYQFFFMGLDMDHLGGLFSTEAGGNGYTNIYFLIVVTRSIVLYLEKQEKLSMCLAKCGTALIVAAMAELKFFFVEFVLVAVMAILFTRFSWRKLTVVLGTLIGLVCCVSLLVYIFPEYTNWFKIGKILESAMSDKGYTSSGDLNRLNAIRRINELWLQSPWQQLFGLGLGNCDTASFAIVNTPFFETYGDMHYTWISYAMIYLETGWIGLVFYWGFFVMVFFRVFRIERKCEGAAKSCCRISRIMAVMCVIISVYNSSLRTEAGYMAYFVLAIPFALGRSPGRRRYA